MQLTCQELELSELSCLRSDLSAKNRKATRLRRSEEQTIAIADGQFTVQTKAEQCGATREKTAATRLPSSQAEVQKSEMRQIKEKMIEGSNSQKG